MNLAPRHFSTAAVRYGLAKEATVCRVYVEGQHPGLKCHEIGFIVNYKQPWLSASPDGFVDDPPTSPWFGLLEIKCPFVAHDGLSLDDYVRCKSSSLSSSFQLKPTHQDFYQVQVAMHVCQITWCDFCVWSPYFCVVERVPRDDSFLSPVLSKLEAFYFSHLLPVLVSESRLTNDV